MISNYFSLSDLEEYAKAQGVDQKPRLQASSVPFLHKLLTTTHIHPVKVSIINHSATNIINANTVTTHVHIEHDNTNNTLKCRSCITLLGACMRNLRSCDNGKVLAAHTARIISTENYIV